MPAPPGRPMSTIAVTCVTGTAESNQLFNYCPDFRDKKAWQVKSSPAPRPRMAVDAAGATGALSGALSTPPPRAISNRRHPPARAARLGPARRPRFRPAVIRAPAPFSALHARRLSRRPAPLLAESSELAAAARRENRSRTHQGAAPLRRSHAARETPAPAGPQRPHRIAP